MIDGSLSTSGSVTEGQKEVPLARTEPFDEYASEYDEWFEENRSVYLSELNAVRTLLPAHSRPVEIGVGTGRFAGPLGIGSGAEPSAAMRDIAQRRGIETVDAVAEDLPFRDASFDLVLMVTTLCFLDDVDLALREAHRVLEVGGHIVIGFLDRETELGRQYEARRSASRFYRVARFCSSQELCAALQRAGFSDLVWAQTVFGAPQEPEEGSSVVRAGHGEGLFVVVRGRKRASDTVYAGK